MIDNPVSTLNTNGSTVGASLIDIIGDDQPKLEVSSATKNDNQQSHKGKI